MHEPSTYMEPASETVVPIQFLATNVTGTQSIPVEVDGSLSVRSVTDSIVDRMALPANVPWALRDDTSAYLDEGASIGSQIGSESNVVITPKTHLGAESAAGCRVARGEGG